MIQVALSKGHKEADALYLRNIQSQTLNLLVVEQVHILAAHLVEVVFPLDAHRGDFHPVSVLPIASGSGNLPQIDLRVEVGGEGVAVVAAVAVQNVYGVNGIELMLLGIGAVGLGHAGIEAAAQQRRQTRFLEFLPVGPLPTVVEVGGEACLLAPLFINGPPFRIICVLRLVVCGVHVVDPAGQTGIHNGQVLIGQGDVHHQIGFVCADEVNDLPHIIRIHLGGGDFGSGLWRQLCGQLVALGFRAAGNAQFAKHLADLTAFVDSNGRDTAAANNKNFAHVG